MVSIRQRDFEKKADPIIDVAPITKVVETLGKQIKSAAQDVKNAIPENVRVTKWDFDIQHDSNGRLENITATAAAFSAI